MRAFCICWFSYIWPPPPEAAYQFPFAGGLERRLKQEGEGEAYVRRANGTSYLILQYVQWPTPSLPATDGQYHTRGGDRHQLDIGLWRGQPGTTTVTMDSFTTLQSE